MLVGRLSFCTLVATLGLVASPPARAQELIDVAALEAQVEAAAELTELPTEPDWGVPDPSSSLPAVAQDAPEVPPAAAEAVEAPPEPRYQAAEPQYHAEYQPPTADPPPSPAPQQPTEASGGEPVQAPVQVPATPAPQQVPVEPVQTPAVLQQPSAPTIWIWVWNWTWIQGTDERYRATQDQYQIDSALFDQNVARIMERIGAQMPVQIGIQKSGSIADEILGDIVREAAPVSTAPVVTPGIQPPRPAYRAPAEKVLVAAPPARRVERSVGAPLVLPTLATAVPTSTRAAKTDPREARRGGKGPRVRRASRPDPALPAPAERYAESGTASGGASGFYLKSFAVLIASLVLAALGRGRRLRLPSLRWRGLLGTRTDPPG